VLHAARRYTGRKNRQKIAICAPSEDLSGCIFATKARIDNRKKLVKQQYLLHTCTQYGELGPTNGEIGSGVGRHLYSAGRPSRWALADISSFICVSAMWRIIVRVACNGSSCSSDKHAVHRCSVLRQLVRRRAREVSSPFHRRVSHAMMPVPAIPSPRNTIRGYTRVRTDQKPNYNGRKRRS